jgi:hypothetical protein
VGAVAADDWGCCTETQDATKCFELEEAKRQCLMRTRMRELMRGMMRGDERFGGLTPSEAAQKRWAEERARQVSGDGGNAGAIPTDAEIVAALRRKAEKGDAAAARELREWRTLESSATQGDLWMELLTPRERQFVRRVIDRALKRAERASPTA